jgi:hypothetical protein
MAIDYHVRKIIGFEFAFDEGAKSVECALGQDER